MASPNLAALLNTKAEDVKRPVPLPQGTFYGIIKSHEFTESSKKKTPGVLYTIQVTHAHEDVDLSEFEAEGGVLAEKNLRTTYWISPGALFMLTEFIGSCGIETEGRTLNELIPQVVGQPVVIDLLANPNRDGDGFYNEVKSIKGANAS